MYQAAVFNVFIASPVDVLAEKQIVRERMERWNVMHSMSKQAVLLPLAYETHAPSLVGRSPQDVINEYVLEDADYLIAIFWSRLGSGATIEEIERHIQNGKPASLFFCSRPIEQEHSQGVQEVLALKDQYKNRSFYNEFREAHDFKDTLDSNLNWFADRRMKDIGEYVDLSAKYDPSDLSLMGKDVLRVLSGTNRPLRIQNFGNEYQIDSGSHSFYFGSDSRKYAEWKELIDELLDFGLIDYMKSISHGDVYELSAEGWRYADTLRT